MKEGNLVITGIIVKDSFIKKIEDDLQNIEMFSKHGFYLDENQISLHDWFQRFVDFEEMAFHLAPYVNSGSIVFDDGIDSPLGFEFDGIGNVFKIDFFQQRGKKLSEKQDPQKKSINMNNVIYLFEDLKNKRNFGVAECIFSELNSESKNVSNRKMHFEYFNSEYDCFEVIHLLDCNCKKLSNPYDIFVYPNSNIFASYQ